jgi:hypothetical protein
MSFVMNLDQIQKTTATTTHFENCCHPFTFQNTADQDIEISNFASCFASVSSIVSFL